MSRWHDAGCLSPQVDVKNGLPECRNCNQSADLSSLMPANTSSAPLIPVDEPLGSMNLWWPSSVPYINQAESEHSLTDSSPGAVISVGGADSDGKATATLAMSAPSTIYPQSLRPTEIRLAVLSAAKSHDFPVHLELEVYELDDCPEYEAVSYLWGGENDDSTLCCPIYIGPFWDVLFQTRNCYDMLQFMRPWRGVRTIWVDAVCINKNDTPERGKQVANMTLIYSGSTRVVAYLGSDLAIPLAKRHPRRHSLLDLASGNVVPESPGYPQSRTQVTMTNLLERRYFSRVWIVQELLLSNTVSMRVGDVDFWANALILTHISDTGLRWEVTAAPWVEYLSQGTQSGRGIRDLLSMTSRTGTTDPRDRIFGLMGIAPMSIPEDNQNFGPGADYSLSCQHIFIGTFVYCLIAQRDAAVLHAACGMQARKGYPTWAPDWKSHESWKNFFFMPKVADLRTWTWTVMSRELRQTSISTEVKSVESIRMFYVLTGELDVTNKTPDMTAHVSSATGALHINLTQYISIKTKPTRISTQGSYHIFQNQHNSEYIVHVVSRYLLDEQNFLGNEQIFVSFHSSFTIYLILRPVDGKKNSFSLIATSPFVAIGPTRPFNCLNGPCFFEQLQSSLTTRLQTISNLRNEDLQPPSDDSEYAWRAFFPHTRRVSDMMELVLCIYIKTEIHRSVVTPSDLEEAYLECVQKTGQVRIEETHMEPGQWLEFPFPFIQSLCNKLGFVCYLSHNHSRVYAPPGSKYHTKKHSDTGALSYIVLTISREDWEENGMSQLYKSGSWEFRRGDMKWTLVSSRNLCTTYDLIGDWVEVRCKSSLLVDSFKPLYNAGPQLHDLWLHIKSLLELSCGKEKTLRDLLAREPIELDDYIGCPKVYQSPSLLEKSVVRKALGISGRTSLIEIV